MININLERSEDGGIFQYEWRTVEGKRESENRSMVCWLFVVIRIHLVCGGSVTLLLLLAIIIITTTPQIWLRTINKSDHIGWESRSNLVAQTGLET